MYLNAIKLNKQPESSSYLSKLPFIQYLESIERLELTKPVTFLVGENGTGKSTLLEALAVAMGFNAEGGSRDFIFSTRDSHSVLYEYITAIKSRTPKDGFFLRAESFYNTASYIEHSADYIDNSVKFKRYGGISFHEQSHGEAFLSLVLNRFEGRGLYILDEPEAALSPQRLLSLITAIDNLVKRDSQFVIATHSPILMAYPNAEIFELSESGIKSVSYKDTAHYKITKQFLNNPEQMLKYLLSDDDIE